MSEIIFPAATVVVLCDFGDETRVLLLRRNPTLVFAGNCWVFPGGKVEQQEIAATGGDLLAANRTAAVRECFEETGISLDQQSLTPISHWTTPDIRPKRFATQFFISQLTSVPEVVVDQSEIVEFQWLTAGDALSAHQQGQLIVMAPTLVTLSELSRLQSYEEISRYYCQRRIRTYNPRVKVCGKAKASFLYEGDSGYPDNNPEIRDQLNRCEMNNGIMQHYCNLD